MLKLRHKGMTTSVCQLLCERLMDAYSSILVSRNPDGGKSEGLFPKTGTENENTKVKGNERKKTKTKQRRSLGDPKNTNPCCFSTQAGGTVNFVKPARDNTEKGKAPEQQHGKRTNSTRKP